MSLTRSTTKGKEKKRKWERKGNRGREERKRERENERTNERKKRRGRRGSARAETRVRSRTRESFDWAFNPGLETFPAYLWHVPSFHRSCTLATKPSLRKLVNFVTDRSAGTAAPLTRPPVRLHSILLRALSSSFSSAIAYQPCTTVDTNHSSLLSTGGDETPLPVGRSFALIDLWQRRRRSNIFFFFFFSFAEQHTRIQWNCEGVFFFLNLVTGWMNECKSRHKSSCRIFLFLFFFVDYSRTFCYLNSRNDSTRVASCKYLRNVRRDWWLIGCDRNVHGGHLPFGEISQSPK